MPSAQQRWHLVQSCSQLRAPQHNGLKIAPLYPVHHSQEPWETVQQGRKRKGGKEKGREERERKGGERNKEEREKGGEMREEGAAVHNSVVALSSLSVAVGVSWCSKPNLVQLAQCHLHGTLLEDVTLQHHLNLRPVQQHKRRSKD